MRSEGLFEPEPDSNARRAKPKKPKKSKAKKEVSIEAIPKRPNNAGDLITRFANSSKQISSVQFNKVELESRSSKQEEKGIIVPRVDYIND